MAMNIKPNFTPDDIKKQVQRKLDKIELAVINRLKFTGETFVKNARENANFTDRTGNLRNSIGYAILKNGEVIEENFKQVSLGTQGEHNVWESGPVKSQLVVAEVAVNFPKGFVLIVVAGMNYAAAVESNNLDVLTASSLLAEEELKRAISRLNEKIGQMQ